ncbi:MAG: DUF4105 domain-containing protein [Planctomycetes bacterium]|nr:DUF4105 domain-containing protein [Planctomycetota bacterium]
MSDKKSWVGRIIPFVVAWMIIAPVILLLTTFNTLFLWNTSLPWALGRGVASVVFVGAVIAAFVALRPHPKALALVVVLILGVFAWFHFLPPSNDRDWRPEVAQVARAEIDGDRLTIENVRNFRYRGEEDFDEEWTTRTYDLSTLEKVETYFCYWGPTDIAHTMLTFRFADDEQLCLSVEVRKEMGEAYSPIASFFKKFELAYIFADERDLVALRSNHRNEDLYLFPSPLPPEKVRALLLDILARANSLADTPEFYGTIKDNCTTSLVKHINKVRDEPIPFSIDLLLNGHIPEMAWRQGKIGDKDTPFEIVKERYAISARAQAYGDGPEFSRRIRDGLGADLK